LKLIQSLNVAVIVPGHGPLATLADVQHQIDYWDWLQTTLHPLAHGGMGAHQASELCLRSQGFQSSAFAQWLAPERLYTSACTLYREWGLPLPSWPGPLGALNHFRVQASLVCAVAGQG
jgi:cyclase